MIQKECNCKTCSGVLPELYQENTTEVTKKEERSINEQLLDIIYNVSRENFSPEETIQELYTVTNQIDSLDDEILNLQNEVLSNPKEYTQVKLGELSKKLY